MGRKTTTSLMYKLAPLFLKKIQDELDPSMFSQKEIIEEGLEGVLIDYYGSDPSEKARRKRVELALEILMSEGKIEKIEGERDLYRITPWGTEDV